MKKKVVKKIFTSASLLLYKFFDLNYLFFYEFFDLFSQVNGSDCFHICSNKSKYDPYCSPKCRLDTITIVSNLHYNWSFFRDIVWPKFGWWKRKLSKRFLPVQVYYCINFLILTICFFMNFLTCLVRLMVVIVFIFVQTSLNMIHIVVQNVG